MEQRQVTAMLDWLSPTMLVSVDDVHLARIHGQPHNARIGETRASDLVTEQARRELSVGSAPAQNATL